MTPSPRNPNKAVNPSDRYTDTDLCVKCGLCLPHCPTYTQTQDENESPRGRLALIQGYARGALAATSTLVGHVDGCLLCRACETACPAKVPYGRIVDRFRQDTGESAKPMAARMKAVGLRKLLTSPTASGLAGKAGGMMQRWFDGSGVFGELGAGLPASAPVEHWIGEHPAQGKEIAKVMLFLGCTASLLDAATVNAALRLLTRLGVRVRVPEGQTCCGAMHRHAGEATEAEVRMRRNLAAFGSGEEEAILSFASGCGSMLYEYPEALSEPEAGRFSRRVRDIGAFLAQLAWPEEVRFRPLPATVSLHAPCSLRNVLKAERHPAALLARIPGLRVVPLPPQTQCCGAAGSHMLERPEMAGRLRENVLDRILDAEPGFLATSNPGCAMHLRAGLRQRGRQDIEVVHPLVLLERQMEIS